MKFNKQLLTYQWIYHGVWHCQPVEGKIKMLNVACRHNLAVMIRVDEKQVIREPTDWNLIYKMGNYSI